MANIFNLPEATGVSNNDYIYISGLTNGDRRIKAEKLVGGDPVLVTKSITENGTYNASSDNAEGYSSVTVNVAGGVVTISQSDYDALSQAEKMNGSAYLITSVGDEIDLTNATITKESSMLVTGSQGGCDFTYNSGASIGAALNKRIDMTNIESIRYNISLSGLYGGGTYANSDLRAFYIGVSLSAISNYVMFSSSPQKVNIYEKIGTYQKQILDVSALSGYYYLNFLGNGATATITDLTAYTNDGKIMYLDNKYLSM